MKTEKVMHHLVGKTYKEVIAALSFDEDQGDCCGYAGCEITDCVKGIEGAESAYLREVIRIDYETDQHWGGERVVINFIFDIGDEKGVILGYELTAGSGSGWAYGAECTLKYGDEEVATASW